MNLEIDNNLEQTKAKNKDVESFINELSTALNKKEPDNIPDIIYKEVLKEMPLASNYKEQLEDIISKCVEDMSYDREFYYFDYDTRKKEYYLEYYCDGEMERIPVPDEELEDNIFKKGTFWKPIADDEVMLADFIKDGIKIRVDSALDRLDFQNKKELENNGLSKNSQYINRKKSK